LNGIIKQDKFGFIIFLDSSGLVLSLLVVHNLLLLLFAHFGISHKVVNLMIKLEHLFVLL
jgi:hypothetical protein